MSAAGLEIKRKIDLNNRLIEEALRPNQFTLNNTVAGLLIEIDSLQKQCSHEYDEEGFCVYCYKMKEE